MCIYTRWTSPEYHAQFLPACVETKATKETSGKKGVDLGHALGIENPVGKKASHHVRL